MYSEVGRLRAGRLLVSAARVCFWAVLWGRSSGTPQTGPLFPLTPVGNARPWARPWAVPGRLGAQAVCASSRTPTTRLSRWLLLSSRSLCCVAKARWSRTLAAANGLGEPRGARALLNARAQETPVPGSCCRRRQARSHTFLLSRVMFTRHRWKRQRRTRG